MRFILIGLICLLMYCAPKYTVEVVNTKWIDSLQVRGAKITNIDTIYTNGRKKFIVEYK